MAAKDQPLDLDATLREARKALHCLYIAVETHVADDVNARVEQAFAAYEQLRAPARRTRHADAKVPSMFGRENS